MIWENLLSFMIAAYTVSMSLGNALSFMSAV